MDPEVKHAVQEDVGERRADALLSGTPASSHIPISFKTRGSAILCATIRINHSWSTESKKLRMSASSTQVTCWLIRAVCNAASAGLVVPPAYDSNFCGHAEGGDRQLKGTRQMPGLHGEREPWPMALRLHASASSAR